MRRGDVWQVAGLGRDRVVLVVGNDAVHELYPSVQTVEIAAPDAVRETLVTVRIEEPMVGIALVAAVGPTPKKRFTEQLGSASPETMDQIAVALRAVYDLP